MKAGQLRHRITLQALTVELDSDGTQNDTWADAFPAPLWSAILPLSGAELMAAQAVQSKVETRFVVRYRPDIVPSMRAVHRGIFYNIEAIVPDNQSGREWLTLHCASGVNEG